jgi:predicted Zn-dependent protease
MNSKQWAKVRMNQSAKTLTMTKQIFPTMAKGMESLGVSKTFAIMNQKGIEKLVSEGWSVVDTKVTNNITKVETVKEIWQPQYIVGGSIEEEIRSYVSKKKQKQAVHFVKGLYEINEKSKVTALEVFGKTRFERQTPLNFHKAYDAFEKTIVGRKRKAQQMQMMEATQ